MSARQAPRVFLKALPAEHRDVNIILRDVTGELEHNTVVFVNGQKVIIIAHQTIAQQAVRYAQDKAIDDIVVVPTKAEANDSIAKLVDKLSGYTALKGAKAYQFKDGLGLVVDPGPTVWGTLIFGDRVQDIADQRHFI